jgi:hypothetical protein
LRPPPCQPAQKGSSQEEPASREPGDEQGEQMEEQGYVMSACAPIPIGSGDSEETLEEGASFLPLAAQAEAHIHTALPAEQEQSAGQDAKEQIIPPALLSPSGPYTVSEGGNVIIMLSGPYCFLLCPERMALNQEPASPVLGGYCT